MYEIDYHATLLITFLLGVSLGCVLGYGLRVLSSLKQDAKETAVRVITPGEGAALPPEIEWPRRGTCGKCGCVVECDRRAALYVPGQAGLSRPIPARYFVRCPMKGCTETINLWTGD